MSDAAASSSPAPASPAAPASPPRSFGARVARGCGLAALLLAVLAGVGVAVIYERSERRVKSTARDLKVTPTPELLARGKYLASISCDLCHGADGAAMREFTIPVAHTWAANISQDKATGLGAWSDGQIEEALRRGVRSDEPEKDASPAPGGKRARDCRILRPPMPLFSGISDQDALALIAHLRTLAPVSKPSRPPELPPLGRFVFALAKKPAHSVPHDVPAPAPDKVGEYLANEICRCADCHHPRVHNEPVAGRLWSGGFRLEEPGLPPVLSANVTPDEVEGIGKWTRAQFVTAVTTGTSPAGRRLHEAMPRYPLSEADAGAVFDYLKAQPPVRAHVWSQEALRGDELYAAHGCASCHGLDGKGPRADITKLGATADVAKIKAWIKDPAAVKPETQMPNLHIEDDKDLEALARFVVEMAQHAQ